MVYLFLSIESGSYSYSTSGLPEVLSYGWPVRMCAEEPYLEGNYVRFQSIFYRRTEYYSTGGIIGRYSSELCSLAGGKWNGAN